MGRVDVEERAGNFPSWVQSYLRGIIHNNKVNDEATVWIQNFTKSALDLISKAMVIGVRAKDKVRC